MQIHDLNTFAGALGANVFMAVDNGSDTGKLSFTDLFAGDTTEKIWPGTFTPITEYQFIDFYGFSGVNNERFYCRVPVSEITANSNTCVLSAKASHQKSNGRIEVSFMQKTVTFTNSAVSMSNSDRIDLVASSDGGGATLWIDASTQNTFTLTEIDGVATPANSKGVILLKTVTVEAANWDNSTNTVTVEDVTADSAVLVCPIPSDQTSALGFGVYCSGQGVDELTFTCDTTPSVDIEYNVMVVG